MTTLLLKIYGIVLLLSISFNNTNSDDPLLVKVKQGFIRGISTTSVSGKGFYSFLGIPYAKPPVGKLRFKDPVEVDSWGNILEANVLPGHCVQVNSYALATGLPLTIVGNEDCLYLNVFRPKGKAKGGFPVMVFIHGGAFIWGGAREFPPNVLLDEEIVLVVINYRLNIFGFLTTEDQDMPGNYGIKDQIFALKWVKQNIHRFGGNPDMVTIAGQSAGAASVHTLILSPKAKGLFKGAIMESGSLLCSWALSKRPRTTALKLSKVVNCPLKKDQTEEFVKCLQALDVTKLFNAFTTLAPKFFSNFILTPRVDGNILPDKPEVLLRRGEFNRVDVISGSNRDEGAAFVIFGVLSKVQSVEDGIFALNLQNERNPVQILNRLQNYYIQGRPISPVSLNQSTQLLTDWMLAVPQDITSHFHARDPQVNVYQYTFQHRGQRSVIDLYQTQPYNYNWVSHFDEIFYLFNIEDPLSYPDDQLVRKIFVTTWTNFVKTGNPTPNSDLGFLWKKVTPSNFRYLNISAQPHMIGNFRKRARDFLVSLKTQQNSLLFGSSNSKYFRNAEYDESIEEEEEN